MTPLERAILDGKLPEDWERDRWPGVRCSKASIYGCNWCASTGMQDQRDLSSPKIDESWVDKMSVFGSGKILASEAVFREHVAAIEKIKYPIRESRASWRLRGFVWGSIDLAPAISVNSQMSGTIFYWVNRHPPERRIRMLRTMQDLLAMGVYYLGENSGRLYLSVGPEIAPDFDPEELVMAKVRRYARESKAAEVERNFFSNRFLWLREQWKRLTVSVGSK